MLGKINDYIQLDLIGKGGFGDVYLVESVDKVQYALKLIPVNKENKNDAKKQAEMYVKLQHPNILKAREFFYYSQERFLAIVLQYCPDGSLVNLIGKLNEAQVKKIMKQIVEGLTYIHSKKILHRDIKPENILMMKGVPKITDLGLAKIMKTSGMSGKSGTLFYEAPEVLYEQKYGNEADMWSLGIMLLELVLGQRIFKLVKGTLPPGIRQDFPSQSLLDEIKDSELREIIKKMLTKKPEERLSLSHLLNYLNGKKQSKESRIEKNTNQQIPKVFVEQKKSPQFTSDKKIVYTFSEKQKLKSIILSKNNSTATYPGERKQPGLVLVDGGQVRKGSSIRFRIEGELVGVGVAIRNVLVANQFDFKNSGWFIGHGCCLVSSGSTGHNYAYSNSNKERNYIYTGFHYRKGDVVRIEVLQSYLFFHNETKKGFYSMEISFTEEEWKQACFCALLYCTGNSVSIV